MGSQTPDSTDTVPVRDASTVILVRDAATDPRVLMGQRGRKAVFMPGKFVFPGGAVDAGDAQVPLIAPLPALCSSRLEEHAATGPGPGPLATAAIRELWEETGQILGRCAHWDDPPPGWEDFAATEHRPDASALRFVFRAITPPGRPRRFDARFFLVSADRLATDPDDFSKASDELSHLQWIRVSEARGFDLPFVTEVVLAEICARLPDLGPPPAVPFFHNGAEEAAFLSLGGRAL